MSVVMTAAAGKDLIALAEEVFVEFSADPETLANGATVEKMDTHYQLDVDHGHEFSFGFALTESSEVGIFRGFAPHHLGFEVVDAAGNTIAPSADQYFAEGHSHDSKVSSTSIELPGKFDGEKLNAWLDEFLQENGPDVYRMKGVVGMAGQDYRFVFQGVHMIFGSQAAGEWGDETPYNRLVFIGKNLDEDFIRSSLEACLA